MGRTLYAYARYSFNTLISLKTLSRLRPRTLRARKHLASFQPVSSKLRQKEVVARFFPPEETVTHPHPRLPR